MARLAHALARLALLATVLATAAVFLRAELLGALLREQLAGRGLGPAALEVTTADARHTVIRDLSLMSGAATAREITLRYSPAGLAAGRVETVEIAGLAVAEAALRGDLGETLAALGGGGARGAGPPPVGSVAARGARIALAPPLGGAIEADGRLGLSGEAPRGRVRLAWRGPAGQAEATLSGTALAPGAPVGLTVSAQLSLDDPAWPEAVRTRLAAGTLALTAEGRLSIPPALPGGPRAWLAALPRLEGRLALAGLTPAPGLLPGGARPVADLALPFALEAAEGRAALRLTGAGEIALRGADALLPGKVAAMPAGAPVTGWLAPGPLVSWEAQGGDAGRARVAARLALERAEAVAGLSLEARIDHDAAGRRAGPVALAGEATLARLALSAAGGRARIDGLRWTPSGRIGADGALRLAGPAMLAAPSLAAAGGDAEGATASGTLALAREDNAWRLTGTGLTLAAARAALPGGAAATRAEAAIGRLEATLDAAGGDWEARLADPALSAGDARIPGGGTLSAPEAGAAELRLAGGPARWRADAPEASLSLAGAALPGAGALDAARITLADLSAAGGADGLRLAGEARAEGLSGSLAGGGGAPLRFAEAGGTLRIETPPGGAPRLSLAEGRIALPDERLAARAVAAALPLGPGAAGPMRLDARIDDRARPARLAPLALALSGRRAGAALSATGEAVLAGGRVAVPVELTGDLAAGTGRLRAGPATLAFRRGALQPGDLGAALAALGRAEGELTATLTAALGAVGALDTGLDLRLEGVDIARGALAAKGLAGRLRLDSLTPPATAGGQRIEAARVTAGVPLGESAATLQLYPDGRIEVRDATAALAGGTVRVAAIDWRPGQEDTRFEARLDGVSLGRLLRDWRIEGISGEGRLSGTIPVRLGPGGAAIDDGRLAAAGPGVLRVDWGAARERLVAQGQQVRLAVEALEDFRYESLTVAVDQTAGGTLTLGVGLSGANPAVLDGYPFRFNVTLEGALAPILEAVRQGRQIGGGLIRGGIGGGG